MRWNRVDKHFASIVDVNGDCHADLVLLSKESDTVTAIEIFVKKSNVGY